MEESSKDSTTSPSDRKPKEPKVRRIKAGYETYQVKKRNPVTAHNDSSMKAKSADKNSPNKPQPKQMLRGDPRNSSDSMNNHRQSFTKKTHQHADKDGHHNSSSRRNSEKNGNSSWNRRWKNNRSYRKDVGEIRQEQRNSHTEDWDEELVVTNVEEELQPDTTHLKECHDKEDSVLQSDAGLTDQLQNGSISKKEEKVTENTVVLHKCGETEEEDVTYSESMRRKMQGLAILECPCTSNLSTEQISNCDERYCKINQPNLTVRLPREDKVIDDKFLVPSSIEVTDEHVSEHSVLDSDVDSDVVEDLFEQDKTSVKVNEVSDTEINAMFTDKETPHETELFKQVDNPTRSDESQSYSSTNHSSHNFLVELSHALQNEIDRDSSKSSLSRNSSSIESVPSRKLSADSDHVVNKAERNSKSQHSFTELTNDSKDFSKKEEKPIKSKNVQSKKKSSHQMSSILSILNENKELDSNQRPTNDIVEIPQTNNHKNNKQKQGRKQETYNKQTKSAKQSLKKDQIKSRDYSIKGKNNREDVAIKSSPQGGGLITLPASDHIDASRDKNYERHVQLKSTHFSKVSHVDSSPIDSKKQKIQMYQRDIDNQKTLLNKLLGRGFESSESVNMMIQTSEHIQQKYGEMIVQYQDYAFRYDFENALWKSAFHNIILQFREFVNRNDVTTPTIQEIGKLYWNFLQNGIQFLDSLIQQLQETGDFMLEEYIDDPIRMTKCPKQVKLALRSCHLLLISVGDLERYIALLQSENDYSKAQECYKQAQVLVPKNGKSYNQLGVVAVLTKHKLDAIYYYTRSLQASNPILTARERLTAIFQEMKKKASAFKRNHNNRYHDNQNEVLYSRGTPTRRQNHKTDRQNSDHLRDEVWIFYRHGHMFKVILTDTGDIVDLTPNVPSLQSTPSLQKKEHDKVTLKKVNHGFIVHFLFIHCKLYTNVGLEDFTVVHEEALSDFTTLLNFPKASSVKQENLLKYMAVNIFMIHHLLEKQDPEEVRIGTALDFALVFAMDMYAVLCKHCTKLITDNENISLQDQFLPAVRTMLRWLVQHSRLIQQSSVCSMLDVWVSICEFFNAMDAVVQGEMVEKSDGINVYVDEDLFLAGFKPLPVAPLYRSLPHNNIMNGCHNLRISSIKKLITDLDGCGCLPFAYDESEKLYKPVQASVISSSPLKKTIHLDKDEAEEISDDDNDDVVIEDDEEELEDFSDVDELKTQKALLTKQIQESETRRQSMLAILESHRSAGRHLSENSPTYIVADTNCYIDHLQHIRTILDSGDFTLIVPLIVINELDGLKVGSYYDETRFHDHQIKVQESARISVDLLEYRFSERDPSLRAITSSGSEMNTIAFRAEEFSRDRGTNDDIILSCCLKYCKEHISRKEGDTNVLSRDVVLLTNDRNLRLKAHTRFVPTVNIVTFMRMAKFVP